MSVYRCARPGARLKLTFIGFELSVSRFSNEIVKLACVVPGLCTSRSVRQFVPFAPVECAEVGTHMSELPTARTCAPGDDTEKARPPGSR